MKGILFYNPDNERIGLLENGDWLEDGFHCGTPLQIRIDGEWIDTRLETNGENEWYLVGTPIVGANAISHLEAIY